MTSPLPQKPRAGSGAGAASAHRSGWTEGVRGARPLANGLSFDGAGWRGG